MAVMAATTPHIGTATEPIVNNVVFSAPIALVAVVARLGSCPIKLEVSHIFLSILPAKAVASATPIALISGLKTGILFSKIFKISTTLDKPS